MITAFLVRTRDKKPFFSAVTSDSGTKFTALTERAKEIVDALEDEYDDSPLPKSELVVSLDRGMTVDGPMPQSALASAIETAKREAEQEMENNSVKQLKIAHLSDIRLSEFSKSEIKSVIAYKASSFVAERTKTTFNYEVKRVRATWDPSLSIPGTNRRGGWRCPTGTRYGGQITDRFGRNCGWGVARRIANAITNIGERLENVDDRRRGRRVERRNRRMLNRLQNDGQQGGRIEQGLRNIADRLEGNDQQLTPVQAPRPPRRRGDAQANRPQRQPIEPVAPQQEEPRPRAPRRREPQGGNLRDSERRRMEREIEQPGAPRTDDEGRAPARPPRRRRRVEASEQQAERTVTRRPQADAVPEVAPKPQKPVRKERPQRQQVQQNDLLADFARRPLGDENTPSPGASANDLKNMVGRLPLEDNEKNILRELIQRDENNLQFMDDFPDQVINPNANMVDLNRVKNDADQRLSTAKQRRRRALENLVQQINRDNPQGREEDIMRYAKEVIENNYEYERNRMRLDQARKRMRRLRENNQQPQPKPPAQQPSNQEQQRIRISDLLPKELFDENDPNYKRAATFDELRAMVDKLDIAPDLKRALNREIDAQGIIVDSWARGDNPMLRGYNPASETRGQAQARFERAMRDADAEIAGAKAEIKGQLREVVDWQNRAPQNYPGREVRLNASANRILDKNFEYQRAQEKKRLAQKYLDELGVDVPADRPNVPSAPAVAPANPDARPIQVAFQIDAEASKAIQTKIDAVQNLTERAKLQNRWDLVSAEAMAGMVTADRSLVRNLDQGSWSRYTADERKTAELLARRRGANYAFRDIDDAKGEIQRLQGLIRAKSQKAGEFTDNDFDELKLWATQASILNSAVQNWDADTRRFDLASNPNAQHFNPTSESAAKRREKLGDVAKQIENEIANAVNKRQSILAKYVEERYGNNDGAWRDMTKEKWSTLTPDQKRAYIRAAYEHPVIKGTNGKLYQARITGVTPSGAGNWEVNVDFDEVDQNGNILRRRVGYAIRYVHPREGYVKNSHFFVHTQADKGAGLQTVFNQHAFMFLKQIGVSKAKVGAVQDGQFVWARIGFRESGGVDARYIPNAEKALKHFEKFGPGGIISNEEEYWRFKYLVDKANRGEKVYHQDFIFAVAQSTGDKKARAIREEQVKQWFKSNMAFSAGELSFAREGVNPNPGQPQQPARRAPRRRQGQAV